MHICTTAIPWMCSAWSVNNAPTWLQVNIFTRLRLSMLCKMITEVRISCHAIITPGAKTYMYKLPRYNSYFGITNCTEILWNLLILRDTDSSQGAMLDQSFVHSRVCEHACACTAECDVNFRVTVEARKAHTAQMPGETFSRVLSNFY